MLFCNATCSLNYRKRKGEKQERGKNRKGGKKGKQKKKGKRKGKKRKGKKERKKKEKKKKERKKGGISIGRYGIVIEDHRSCEKKLFLKKQRNIKTTGVRL